MKKTRALAMLVLACISGGALATEVGQPAPSFTLPVLATGQPVALKDYAGKVVYLDFWASWCEPCRTSFPLLDKMHQRLKDQGFAVVAVNLDEDKDNAEKFLREHPVTFTVLRDAQGEWADQFVVESMPTSFIIDRQGVVQLVHNGFASDDIKELEAKVVSLLAKK